MCLEGPSQSSIDILLRIYCCTNNTNLLNNSCFLDNRFLMKRGLFETKTSFAAHIP